MQITVSEFIVLTKDQIPQKRLQILFCRGYSFLPIKVVGPYQRIAEVPGVVGKELIGNGVAKTAEVLDQEDCRCARIPFAKRMNLPDSCDKRADMFDGFVC